MAGLGERVWLKRGGRWLGETGWTRKGAEEGSEARATERLFILGRRVAGQEIGKRACAVQCQDILST